MPLFRIRLQPIARPYPKRVAAEVKEADIFSGEFI
jgi:hypothetical protein